MSAKLADLRNTSEFSKLAQVIHKHAAVSEIVYCSSPGNWGDALINYGTKQFLDFYGITHTEVTRPELFNVHHQSDSKNKVLLVGGGGGWCKNWPTTKSFTEEMAKLFKHVIVLPTTFELPLINNSDNISYFTRGLIPKGNTDVHVEFCHDMAFFIDLTVPDQVPKLWRLIAFRGDKEKSDQSFNHIQQVDLSLLGNSYSSVVPFFEIINRFKVVYTDRLHVAIAGSLLQKKIFLLPGNYNKSHDVWDKSISTNYPDTKYLSWEQAHEVLIRKSKSTKVLSSNTPS